MKVYGIRTTGPHSQTRARALAKAAKTHLGEFKLVMVGDFLAATVRALADTARGKVSAVGGCLDDITLPAEHEGFGTIEWRESWLSYLKEHRVAFLALPASTEVIPGEMSVTAVIRGYNRAAEALAGEIRKIQTEQRREAKAEQGGYICGRPPYGYRVKDGAFVIDPARAKAVRYIFEALRAGSSLAELIEALKRKHASGGVIEGKDQFWDRVKIRRILSHARMYCLGQYDGGRGQPIHLPSLAFLPPTWISPKSHPTPTTHTAAKAAS